jgi:hypothetical protein
MLACKPAAQLALVPLASGCKLLSKQQASPFTQVHGQPTPPASHHYHGQNWYFLASFVLAQL